MHRKSRPFAARRPLAAPVLGFCLAAQGASAGEPATGIAHSPQGATSVLAPERAGPGHDSFIVYYRNDAPPGDTHGAAAKRVRRHVNAHLGCIGKAFGLDVRHSRRMDTGGHVIRLGQRKLDAAEADRFIRAFADDSQVLSIEPNIRLHLTTLPNDTCWDSSGD